MKIVNALLVVGLLVTRADPAVASSFSVNPTQVRLTAQATSALLTLRNESDRPLRFQLSVFRWSQTPAGEMALEPTVDIVFFPALLALDAGQERRIRVGTVTGFGAMEKTYRLFVEELPPAEKEAGVTVLTKMGIPIFLEPSKTSAQAALGDVSAAQGRFTFRVQNTGNIHFIPQSIRVTGLGASGQPLFTRDLNGWYVLAGGSRVFDIDLPAETCPALAVLHVTMTVGQTASKLDQRLQVQAAACRP